MADISIHDVQKVEVVKINKHQYEDGRVFYCAHLEITSERYVSGLELSEFDKKHLVKRKDIKLCGDANVKTRISLFAKSKEALEVKLNAFKEDK